MNIGQSVTKPKYKFPIGGIFCIVVSIVSGISTLLSLCRYVYTTVRAILLLHFGTMSLFGNLDIEEVFEGIFHSITYMPVYWLNIGVNLLGYVFSFVGALLFAVLGIMIIARVHSRLLATVSIAQIALGGFSVLHFGYALVMNILNLFTGYDIASVLRSVFTSVRLDGLVATLLTLLGWVLLTVVIFVNCNKARDVEDSGKLKLFAWLTPSAFAASRLLSGVGSVIYALLSVLGGLFLHISFGSPIIPTLLNGLGGGLLSVVMAVLLAVTFYFVTDWIIEPRKK